MKRTFICMASFASITTLERNCDTDVPNGLERARLMIEQLDQSSAVIEILKLNGDFKRNYSKTDWRTSLFAVDQCRAAVQSFGMCLHLP